MSSDVKSDVNERPVGHNPGHARHDRLLVSRFGVGDTYGSDTDAARRLVEQCSDCSRLASDIAILRTSVATLPTPTRTRNFRLTPEQAEQLRGSALDRFLRRLALPQLALVRPIAGVALAVGLVITVVGAGLPRNYLPLGATGAPAEAGSATGQFNALQQSDRPAATSLAAPVTAPSDMGESDTATENTGPGATAAGPDAGGTPKAGETATIESLASSTAGPTGGAPHATATAAALVTVTTPRPTEFEPALPADTGSTDAADTTRLLLIYGGVTLAMIAFAVLLVSIYARRRTDDPLLR